ncbi:S-adenosyl-L-methionine-dependent methyltransferase [Cubamyces sp. BRFM 1775]|nr:S-adenosyl-L-methionine-dependent methyltransferase [Cubamyces sp. BRFM 1775]
MRTYEPVGDEITEDLEVRLRGESAPEEEDDTVPMRTLDDFAVFDAETRAFIPFERLLVWDDDADSATWVAVGTVDVVIESDSDDEDEDGDEDDLDNMSDIGAGSQKLRLSTILECDAHFVSKEHGAFVINSNVYLRTKFAWYALRRPSTTYAPYYRQAWTLHHIVQGLLSTVNADYRAGPSHVLSSLNSPHTDDDPMRQSYDDFAVRFEERDLTNDAVVSYLLYVLDKIHDDHPTFHRRLQHSKVMQTLYPGVTAREPGFSVNRPKRSRNSKDLEKVVLQHRNQTCITSRVRTVAQKLFKQAMRVAEIPTISDISAREARAGKVHHTDPASMQWVDDSMTAPGYYSQVVIDGETYSAGDIVIVEPGHDQDHVRARNAESSQARCQDNVLADTKWFCKINYMFDERDRSGVTRKKFHAQWLQHGCQTLLQEAAHSRGLFWLKSCDDLPLECIYSHCHVQPWPRSEPVPLDDCSGELNRFFVGLTWDSDKCALVEMPAEDITSALSKCKPSQPCVACGLATMEEERAEWVEKENDAMSCDGVIYHVHDFVYLHVPGQVNGLLAIAQIAAFIRTDSGQISRARVRHFGRYDSVADHLSDQGGPVQLDNRRLFRTEVYTTVPLAHLSGKAFVASPSSPWEKEVFILADDHFYCDLDSQSTRVASPDDLRPLSPGLGQCDICLSAVMQQKAEKDRLLRSFGPLRCLELFAGAGGLSTGLEMSGHIQTKWAVEFSPGAAKTFRANHPHAVVYNQCTNKLLEHAIQTAKGLSPKPLRSLDEMSCKDLPPMPQPGDVEFICGGPPCQSFSLMNHHRTADDVRSTLVCNMISYVEFYRPAFFLLENVVGMLSYQLGGKQDGNKVVDGIKMGVVKFILSSLTTLGYQVHFRVLQAGHYGAPQGRRRVIFMGARRDVPLPAFPVPQYCFPSLVHNVNLPTGEIVQPMTRRGADGSHHQCAPLACVTVQEAIGDLPKFDWIDPHIERHATKQERLQTTSRLAQGIAQVKACLPRDSDSLPGYSCPTPYPLPPLSRYQSWLRVGSQGMVLDHYSRWYPPKVVERVVNVPIRPDACHEDLPPCLKPRHALDKSGKPKSHYRTLYGRISKDGQFLTAMTTIAPNAKGGKVLHPEQKRIVTIRECARAQGFPDHYVFKSINKNANDIAADKMRQIGNAVPVPLALALGKEIGNALYKLRRSQEHRSFMERALSPEVNVP